VGEADAGFSAGLDSLLKKYPQYVETPPFRPGAPPTLIAVSPLRTASWAASADVVDFLG
jgi:hypothetical protein